jgi:hypothetical protein
MVNDFGVLSRSVTHQNHYSGALRWRDNTPYVNSSPMTLTVDSLFQLAQA